MTFSRFMFQSTMPFKSQKGEHAKKEGKVKWHCTEVIGMEHFFIERKEGCKINYYGISLANLISFWFNRIPKSRIGSPVGIIKSFVMRWIHKIWHFKFTFNDQYFAARKIIFLQSIFLLHQHCSRLFALKKNGDEEETRYISIIVIIITSIFHDFHAF